MICLPTETIFFVQHSILDTYNQNIRQKFVNEKKSRKTPVTTHFNNQNIRTHISLDPWVLGRLIPTCRIRMVGQH